MSYERRSGCRPPECYSTGSRGRSRSDSDEWFFSDGTGEQQGETGDDRLRCADSHEIYLRPGKGSQESSTIRSSMVHGKECEVLRSACCSYEDEISSVEGSDARRGGPLKLLGAYQKPVAECERDIVYLDLQPRSAQSSGSRRILRPAAAKRALAIAGEAAG